MKTHNIDERHRLLEFDSVLDLVRYAESPCKMKDDTRVSLHDAYTRDDWDYNEGWLGTLHLTKHGWPEGAAKMRALADKLYEKIAPKVNVWQGTRHDVCGAGVDMSAYLSGEPECMIAFEQSKTDAAPPVDILISCSCSYNIAADIICNRGAAILATIDALEQSGCSVSVTVEFTDAKGGYETVNTIRIKRPGEVLDADALAFAIMHPAFFRRLCFASLEHEPAKFRRALTVKLDGKYGHVVDCRNPGAAVYFGALGSKYGYITEDDAIETVLGILRRKHSDLLADNVAC